MLMRGDNTEREMVKEKLKTNKHFTAKRIAALSLLTAMGLIMFMVESLFPPLFLPGAKMGLSNIFSLFTLYLLGPVDAIILVVVRTVLGSVFTGNMSTLVYSLSAGLVSVLAASFLTEFIYPKISVIAISVASAVLHNLTQNVVFCLISGTPQMFSYMPWLALLGVVAGLIVGFAVFFIIKTIPLRIFAGMRDVSYDSLNKQLNVSQTDGEDNKTRKTEDLDALSSVPDSDLFNADSQSTVSKKASYVEGAEFDKTSAEDSDGKSSANNISFENEKKQ